MGMASGVFSMANSRSARAIGPSSGNETVYDAKFGLNGVIPTKPENTVRTLSVQYWRRIS